MNDILTNINAILERKKQINTTIEIEKQWPINIDLYYTSQQSMYGGLSDGIIQQICYKNFLDGYFSGQHSKYGIIRFIVSKSNSTKVLNNCNYYNKGTYTAVYVIKNAIDTPYMPEKNNYLIIRITEEDSFKPVKYAKEKKKFNKYIPKYYFYGKLNRTGLIKQYYYAIVHKYNDMETLLLQPIDNRKLFFKNLLIMLSYFESEKYIVNDFKFHNIAYDDNFVPIIIDYEDVTISPYSEYNKSPQTYQCNKRYKNYEGSKMMSSGLVGIIIKLFFTSIDPYAPPLFTKDRCHDVTNMTDIFKNIHVIMKPQPDVTDKDFINFLKNSIINVNYDGLLADVNKKVPNMNELLMNFNLL